MTTTSSHQAAISNPALHPLNILIGEWKTLGTHPLLPGRTLQGHASFQWLQGGAFLIWHSTMQQEEVPNGVTIFGSDDATGEYFMLYVDERKVSRKYQVSVQDKLVKWWRDAPNFSQRYTWTLANDGNTIVGKGELSKDGQTWEKDLDLTYTRMN